MNELEKIKEIISINYRISMIERDFSFIEELKKKCDVRIFNLRGDIMIDYDIIRFHDLDNGKKLTYHIIDDVSQVFMIDWGEHDLIETGKYIEAFICLENSELNKKNPTYIAFINNQSLFLYITEIEEMNLKDFRQWETQLINL